MFQNYLWSTRNNGESPGPTLWVPLYPSQQGHLLRKRRADWCQLVGLNSGRGAGQAWAGLGTTLIFTSCRLQGACHQAAPLAAPLLCEAQ